MRRAVVVLATSISAASAATPPAGFAAAMTAETCNSRAWTRISDDTWFVHCVSAGKDSTAHRGFVFHHAAGAATFDKLALFDAFAQQARRGSDVDAAVRVTVKRTTVSVASNGFSGEIANTTWDLAVYPPRIVSMTFGNAAAWSHPNAPVTPTCTVDVARRTDRCTWPMPRCDGDAEWDGDPVAFRTIPVFAFVTPRAPPKDPFSCAAVFGDADVYHGKNPKHTTFEAVAGADHGKVTLYLRAKDATPMLATSPGAWQGADHWEIWLARAGTANVDWRDDKPGYCAARKSEYVQVIVARLADGTVEVVSGTPKAKGSIAGASARAGATGELVVELTGTLAKWADDGAITVAYSDSLDGHKQDTLIGSSHVVWGKPESFGRLGRDALCRAPDAPQSLPWK